MLSFQFIKKKKCLQLKSIVIISSVRKSTFFTHFNTLVCSQKWHFTISLQPLIIITILTPSVTTQNIAVNGLSDIDKINVLKNKQNENKKRGKHKRKQYDNKNTMLLFLFYCYFLGSYWIRWIASSFSRTPWINSPSASRSGRKREREGDNWTIFWQQPFDITIPTTIMQIYIQIPLLKLLPCIYGWQIFDNI